MMNTKGCSESETKAPRGVMSPLLHSTHYKVHAYGLPIEQLIDTMCYCWQKNLSSFQRIFFFFFAAVLDCHAALVLAMPVGKPLDIVNSLLYAKSLLSSPWSCVQQKDSSAIDIAVETVNFI